MVTSYHNTVRDTSTPFSSLLTNAWKIAKIQFCDLLTRNAQFWKKTCILKNRGSKRGRKEASIPAGYEPIGNRTQSTRYLKISRYEQ